VKEEGSKLDGIDMMLSPTSCRKENIQKWVVRGDGGGHKKVSLITHEKNYPRWGDIAIDFVDGII
jgi:hypothetical protein